MKVADLVLRPATVEDARFVADLWTAIVPDDPEDPVLQRHYWETVDRTATFERWIAERGGKPAGFAMHMHASWEKMPERFGRVTAELLPEVRTAARLDALFEAMEDRSRADGTLTFTAWAWEFDELRLGVLRARRYEEKRRERFWELDLVANRDRIARMTAEARDRMERERIRVTTLDRDDDPEKWRKLWRLSEEASQDVLTTVPHVEMPFEQFMQWMRSPAVREDRVWIAREGDDVIGVSLLAYPPERGVVVTDWTGTARKVRGRGVARALKCETVTQAIALGVDRVRTDNDSTNTPILHINESMGYRRRPDMIQLMRSATGS